MWMLSEATCMVFLKMCTVLVDGKILLSVNASKFFKHN